jgi:DNA-binding NarL/FixJ family response regulator
VLSQPSDPEPAAPVAPPSANGKITVLIADDHTLIRQGLRRLLEEDPRFHVVGEAADGRVAVDLARATDPDVVIMDLAMPGLSGLEATRRIRKANLASRVLVLSVHADEEYVARALEAGAHGYLSKDVRAPDLFEAIEATAAGRRYLSPGIAETVVAHYLRLRRERATEEASPFQALTGREREILRLLTEGRSSKEVAADLVVSPKTIETHRANIMRKLDIHNIADLVRYAIAQGIVEP